MGGGSVVRAGKIRIGKNDLQRICLGYEERVGMGEIVGIGRNS
jgi:hypothetical protein